MKKEAYMNPQNADQKVLEWKDELALIKSHFPFSIQPSKVALLVLDMQDIFLQKDSHAYIPSSLAITSNIQQLVRNFYNRGGIVIYTRHLSSDKKQDVMRQWWRNPIESVNPASKITNNMDTSKGKIIQKSQYSAFFSTDLKKSLLDNHITQVIITGVMTHLCCETTARDAFMNGFEVFFCLDATASYTEDLHLGTLRSISHGFGKCLSTQEMLNTLNTGELMGDGNE